MARSEAEDKRLSDFEAVLMEKYRNVMADLARKRSELEVQVKAR